MGRPDRSLSNKSPWLAISEEIFRTYVDGIGKHIEPWLKDPGSVDASDSIRGPCGQLLANVSDAGNALLFLLTLHFPPCLIDALAPDTRNDEVDSIAIFDIIQGSRYREAEFAVGQLAKRDRLWGDVSEVTSYKTCLRSLRVVG
jgi:hypothetical protein